MMNILERITKIATREKFTAIFLINPEQRKFFSKIKKLCYNKIKITEVEGNFQFEKTNYSLDARIRARSGHFVLTT